MTPRQKAGEPITNIEIDDVVVKCGDETKTVTHWEYNPRSKSYYIHWNVNNVRTKF